MKLVLASSSPYRRQVLSRLQLPFKAMAPEIDETPHGDEKIAPYVRRLAEEKARALAGQCPDTLIIGSDQACALQGLILGKPGTAEAAAQHLALCSGQWVTFYTGLALYHSGTDSMQSLVETYRVKFRELASEEIAGYIRLDQPLDCAGSFKVEQSGIALFEAMEGRDYNTLLGMPMIALITLLREAGLNPLLAS